MLPPFKEKALSENNGTGNAPQEPQPPGAGASQEAPPSAPASAADADGGAPAETASERAEGQAFEPAAMARELEQLRAAIEESQARARTTQERLKDEHERLLRTAAEFENYKKRAVKEKEDARKFGNESMLKEFLPVADNLDRAIEAAAAATDPKQIIDGVKLVQKLFESVLAKFGVSSFSAVGQPFDPTLHEALMQADSDAAPGTVVQEMAKGYKLHDRLVRPAAVVVAKPRQTSPAAEPSPSPSPTGQADG
jgi:molecular chaperone GrpE